MGNLRKAALLAIGMAALADQSGHFGIPKTNMSFAPYAPTGKTFSAGKPKKKKFGTKKLSRKQRKKPTNKE